MWVKNSRADQVVSAAEPPSIADIATGETAPSHVDLFGYRQSMVNLNAEIAHRALDLSMAEQ